MAKLVAPFDNFYKLTAEQMNDWLVANNQNEFIEKLKEEANIKVYPKISVPVLNDDRTPKMKLYHPIKNGVKQKGWESKPVIEMVEDRTQEPKYQYNHDKAKKMFCAEYCPSILPTKKEKKEKKANPFAK